MYKLMRVCLLTFCVFCLIVGISGCSTPEQPEESFARTWGFGGALYANDVIPDKETAVSVATAIFNNLQNKGTQYSDYVPISTRYHEENEAWIILFHSEPADSAIQLGGGCTIILRKSDACVLGIVFGE